MKKYDYVKVDAFTSGSSKGNPAAAVFMGKEPLSADEMQECAKEHKGFVMEMVFLEEVKNADCKLTYYSSECEVEFCGHGTIATMYHYIKNNPSLIDKASLIVDTNKKGQITVYNKIKEADAVFVSAPKAEFYDIEVDIEELSEVLKVSAEAIDTTKPISLIDAGLRTLIVPVKRLEDEISIFPTYEKILEYNNANNIDIMLIYSLETDDRDKFAHTRVFAPKFGYLEDPATGSGNSAFANYLLKNNLWDGKLITVEQGGNDRVFNEVKLECKDNTILFGGRATTKIEGIYTF